MTRVCLAALFVGCGGSQSGELVRGAEDAEVVEAPAPSVSRYATAPSDSPAIGENAAIVERGLLAAARAQSVDMQGDGRLALLAAWTAERLGDGATPPPHEVVEFFSRHLGIVEPVPHVLILGQPDPALLERGITESVTQFLERQPYNRYGAAVIERQGLTLAVVTLSWRWLDLEPVPRQVDAGSTVELRGRLVGDYREPTFAIARPDGSVERTPVGAGPEFDFRYVPRESGVHKVELLARGPRGDTVIANFPLFVGVDVPQSVALAVEEDVSGDPSAVSAALLRLIQRTRRESGLEPVTQQRGLAEVALAHSRDMVEHDFIAHTSQSNGTTAAQRVEAAGIRTGLVLENIGRGYSALEIHRGLLGSPGHRANILNADVTHVGIGVVAEDEGGRPAFVATQLFVSMPAEIDVGGAPEELLAAINRGRRARNAGSLEVESNLERAAQAAAERFFEDRTMSQQDVVDEASGGLGRMGIAYSRVGGVMAVVTRLADASRLEPAFDAEARYVGIGVAQGTRPDTAANAIAVVILLAWPR
jgi:uncharacterized protein YkwD